MSVPKVIHYCWFGHGELPETAQKSIETWKAYAPEFEIKRWDESNIDIGECEFAREAYSAKKWAFVSDFVRFKVLYEHGGIYMDVGSELIRDLSPLLKFAPFSAIESSTKTVSTGLVACCEAASPVVGEVLAKYRSLHFVDTPEFLRSHTVNEIFTSVFEKSGYARVDEMQRVLSWTLLPCEYFDPPLGFKGHRITQNTFSVHRGSASWAEPKYQFKKVIERKISPFVGRRLAQIVGRVAGEVNQEGLVQGLKNCIAVSKNLIGKDRS